MLGVSTGFALLGITIGRFIQYEEFGMAVYDLALVWMPKILSGTVVQNIASLAGFVVDVTWYMLTHVVARFAGFWDWLGISLSFAGKLTGPGALIGLAGIAVTLSLEASILLAEGCGPA